MRRLFVTTRIDAPAAEVWKHLTDTEAYPDWNPFITQLSGELEVGARVQVRIRPPGGRAMLFRPTVTAYEPMRHLQWLGRLGVRGVFDGRHVFTLEELADKTTRLTQSEEFSGLLVPLTASTLARTEAGFAAMNEALRARAEGYESRTEGGFQR